MRHASAARDRAPRLGRMQRCAMPRLAAMRGQARLPAADRGRGVPDMIETNRPKRQEIKMMNRKTLEISGVLNVESFDSEEFLLETECGFLTIRGTNLHMKTLNLEQGLVAIEGLVSEIVYLDGQQGKSKGFIGKLFK